jgi:threonine/homoserine/homoserine lactone efflux protein
LTVIAPATLAAFAITCTIIEMTPGPNMAWLAALSLARGLRVGLAAVAGVMLGLAAYGVAAALGLAAIIANSAIAYEVLRWGGVAYLLWLAWDAWSSADEISPQAAGDRATLFAFRRGLITNLLNPKAAVFYMAVLPDFVAPQASGILAQTLTLSAIYVAIATAIHALIVVLASRLRGLVEDPVRRRPIRRVLAIALAGVAIWLAWGTAR